MELQEGSRKRLFNLAAMKELINNNSFLKTKYDKLSTNAEERFGYHWNEFISAVLYNKYVKPNKDLMERYKVLKNRYEMEKQTKNSKTVDMIKNELNEMTTSGGGGSVGDGTATGNNSGAYATPAAWSGSNKARRFFNDTMVKGSKIIKNSTPDNNIKMNESFDLDELFEEFSSNLNSLNEITPEKNSVPKVFTYHIVTNNDNDFYADVRDEDSNTVFEIKTLDELNNYINSNQIKFKEDIEGLSALLKKNNIIQNEDVVKMAEVNENVFVTPQNLGLVKEEVKPNGLVQADRIKEINKENSLNYYKTLNDGIQDMIKDPKEYNTPVEVTIKYEFDNNGVDVVNGVFPEEGKYNDEYKKTAHRGMEDLQLDREDEVYDKRLKDMIGDKAYNIVKDKQKVIKNKDLKNLQKAKTEVVPSMVKESFLSGYYLDNYGKREIRTTKLSNVKEIETLNEDTKFFETKAMGNIYDEVLKEEIEKYNFYYSLNENLFLKIEKEKDLNKHKNILNESAVKKVKHLFNYDPSLNVKNVVDRSKL